MAILFDNISHIEYHKSTITDVVNCIKAGEIYQPIFNTVEDSVVEEDTRKGFWVRFWGDGLLPKYKAVKDRWSYKYDIGTIKFIEDHHPDVKYVAGEWFFTPKLVVYYMNQDKSVLYFNSNSEMMEFIESKFPNYHGLKTPQHSEQQKIVVA